MGHNPRGFWYKIHASYFYKGTVVLADLVAEFVECPEEMNVEKHGMDEK